jgi:anti-sigma B factor antagonist
MEVKATRLGVVTYLSPDGPLAECNLKDFGARVRAVEATGPVNIVVDLTHVPFLDSPGLEFLLDLSIQLKEAGGSLRLANPNATCRDILSLTKLDQIILVCESIETAGRSFI